MNTINSIEYLINQQTNTVFDNELGGVWNKVWVDSSVNNYSNLRRYKTIDKIANLETMGVDFSNKKILDIGCGNGSLLVYLNEKYNAVCTGIDISTEVIEQASMKSTEDISFRYGDHRNLSELELNSYDIVISLGVIEHFDEYGLAIAEVRRVLKPGGVFIMIQPHLLSFGTIQEYWLRIVKKWRFGKQYDFSFRYYVKLLKIMGYRGIKYTTLPPYADMGVIKFLDKQLKRVYPSWGHYLYLVAKK